MSNQKKKHQVTKANKLTRVKANNLTRVKLEYLKNQKLTTYWIIRIILTKESWLK